MSNLHHFGACGLHISRFKIALSWADCDPFLNIALVIKTNPSLLACSIARDLIMQPHQPEYK